jgi:hypothetical protein
LIYIKKPPTFITAFEHLMFGQRGVGLFLAREFPHFVWTTDPIQRFLAKGPYDVGRHERCILLARGLKKMRHGISKTNED